MKRRQKSKKELKEFQVEIQEPKPIFKETGERDYFAEYYRSYRNDYIDQYMRAYRELKDINAAFKKADEEMRNRKRPE